MSTSIKIDFDPQGLATFVRVTTPDGTVLASGDTCDLSTLHGLVTAIKGGAGAVEVLGSVELALEANQITLVEAERIKRREQHLDGLLTHKRTQVAALDEQIRDAQEVKAIVDKRAVLVALEEAVQPLQETLAIVDKRAELARLDGLLVETSAALPLVPAEPVKALEPPP